MFKSSLVLDEFSEDVLEDAAVLEVLDFGVGVESGLGLEGDSIRGLDGDDLTDGEVAALKVNVEGFGASEAERVGVLSILELKRQDTHAHQVGSVNSFVRLSDHSLDALKVGTLGGPVSRGSGSVFLTSENDEGSVFLLVLSGGVVDGHFLS